MVAVSWMRSCTVAPISLRIALLDPAEIEAFHRFTPGIFERSIWQTICHHVPIILASTDQWKPRNHLEHCRETLPGTKKFTTESANHGEGELVGQYWVIIKNTVSYFLRQPLEASWGIWTCGNIQMKPWLLGCSKIGCSMKSLPGFWWILVDLNVEAKQRPNGVTTSAWPKKSSARGSRCPSFLVVFCSDTASTQAAMTATPQDRAIQGGAPMGSQRSDVGLETPL